jgi:PEP-CTERM putative exosortase interaction domain
MRRILFALALLAPLAAHADTLDVFTFNFAASPDLNPNQFSPPLYLSVVLPASPIPIYPSGLCYTVDCFAVVANVSGIPFVFDFSSSFLEFAPAQQGIPVSPFAYTKFHVPLLYSGTTAAPTFLTGTFNAGYQWTPNQPLAPGTITITPVDTNPVPEPSTVFLLSAGTLIGVTQLRRR